ncbi:electron transfer flavoprotein subunit alpha/FixB family protein [Brevibacillus sp. B_LB10_24]|uniref:electron transfer flavoprotein subunit alpha/FixB family protein n=1 Tax=Brevibacillus sp. B_LB10_24 TaxID=3380645 RepID=UPI0038BB5DAC
MHPDIICCLPVAGGTGLAEQAAWGLVKAARQLARGRSRLIGIVVHCGLKPAQYQSLPLEEVYHVQVDEKLWKLAESHVEALQGVMRKRETARGIYLFASTPLYQEAAVRLSIRCDGAIITNAMEIFPDSDGERLIAKREIYGGKAHEYLVCDGNQDRFITLDPACLYGEKQREIPTLVQEVPLQIRTGSGVRFLSEASVTWQEMNMTEARCVIGIGRGVYGSGAIGEVIRLADLLNAPIGGSKVADELGLIPREKRIGSSGCQIDADIYVAIGISGSSQHLEGIKGVKHVIAVNSDPSAPIFQRCDIGVVGDLKEVLPKLVEAVSTERRREECHGDLRIG